MPAPAAADAAVVPAVPFAPVPAAPAEPLADRVRPYLRPDHRRAWAQIASALGPYLGLWALMAWGVDRWPYAVVLLLAVPAAGFLTRTFILQHDLGHGSLFARRRTNDRLGRLCGLLTLTPYHHWRRLHCEHHAHHGDLDHRGPGYIRTLTVREYLALPPRRRLLYRLYRNPALMFGIGSWYYFLIAQRYPYGTPRSWKRERRSVYLTDLALAALAVALAALLGWQRLAMVHLPLVLISAPVGMWIFYVQHQFEDTYWEPGERWNFVRTALEGSSYFKLPRLLAWFTADVGLHHVHHLSPRIPNYHLESCRRAIPELWRVPPLTLGASLRTARLKLWDEDARRMIGWRELAAAAR